MGYAVVWKKGRSWAGRKAHMGYFQEAYDVECAAIARPVEAAEKARRRKLGRVRIFTDAQDAITRGEPGPGQTYALQARKAIAALREPEPSVEIEIEIEIRWCPAHKGIPWNEVADGRAKQAASEPDDHGVEWLVVC